MRIPTLRFLGALLACLLVLPVSAPATDVDGPNDCLRLPVDFGDAPEVVFAYPGVPGCFPTCLSASGPGTQTFACLPISTAPGLTGFVRHVTPTGAQPYWLGCAPAGLPPQGIDSEADGKMNALGLGFSACLSTLAVDCAEAAFGMTFGQDECTGDSDAGISALPVFSPCTSTSFAYSAYNCGTTRQVFLNVLVDWNQDGDWNDNFECAGPPVACAFEWAVKNVPVILLPGCNALVTPAFLSGPGGADAWVRITISDDPVNDDYPWAGVATMANPALRNGETEDYPWGHTQPCPEYRDFGDAPEEVQAYPGIAGRFPTCITVTPPGDMDIVPLCPPISTPPGPTGYVMHVSTPADPFQFWLGCGPPGVDGEIDGKTNDTGAALSICNTAVAVDCFETNFGLTFGQDECYGDLVDAGLAAGKLEFIACQTASFDYQAYNCKQTTQQVYLNVLVDMNQDGDWNDNFVCPGPTVLCAYEWAVKNVVIGLAPGCNVLTTPGFLMGPEDGNGWMRITLTATPVTDDFPWDGSAGGPGGQGFFVGGETEDYPVKISGGCPPYRDFGDAPEEITAYTTGIMGHFPTCLFPSGPGTQEIDCGLPLSTPPGATGYVMHVSLASDPSHYWLGCPLGAVDGESDGKTNVIPPFGPASACDSAVPIDCVEALDLTRGQDECYGDADAGLPSFVSFGRCSVQTVKFDSYNCEDQPDTVFLNILVDWNQDADWNDVVLCFAGKKCAPVWAVKNVLITLAPGCNTITSPTIQVGPREGMAWMRITLSSTPAPDDFPWTGTAGLAGGAFFNGGETEDYPVRIDPSLVSVDGMGGSGDLWLAPIVPNPASGGVLLRFSLPRDEEVSLAAYDIAGRRLALLASGRMAAGEHPVTWNFRDEKGTPIPVGYYVVKLRVGDRVLTQRGIRIR